MSLPWSGKGSKGVPVGADEVMLLDSEDSNPETENKRARLDDLPSSGQINTASNVGTGEGVFKQKSGVNLEFRSLLGETNKVVLTGNTTDITFTLGSLVVATNKANTYGDFAQTFPDNQLFIQNPAATFTYQIIASAIGDNRTLTLPSLTANDIFVAENFTQTLTNKTLITPIISTITNSGPLTLPTGPQTLVGRTTFDTLSNKTLTFPVISTISNSGTLTLPTGTDTLVARTSTDTLTNKTLTMPVIAQIVNTGTLTLPTTSDTLMGRNTIDIFTNKTFNANADGNMLSNVDVADLANGQSGQLITWDTSGFADTVAAGTSGQVLTSQGPTNVPVFSDTSAGTIRLVKLEGSTVATNREAINFIDTDNDIIFLVADSPSPSQATVSASISTTYAGGVNIVTVGTIATGTWGPMATTIAVASGGTGVETLTDKGVLFGNAASAVGVTTVGTLNQVLTSNGSGVAPSFKDASSVTFPVSDAIPIIKGSVDDTKLLRFEIDGFSSATTRVLTPPNADGTLALLQISQTFSGINTFTAGNIFTQDIRIEKTGGTTAAKYNATVFNNDSADGGFISGNKSRGTLASPSAVILDDICAGVEALGHTGSAFEFAGFLCFTADGTFTPSSTPMRFEIFTTPASSTTQVKRFEIGSDGITTITFPDDTVTDGLVVANTDGGFTFGNTTATASSFAAEMAVTTLGNTNEFITDVSITPADTGTVPVSVLNLRQSDNTDIENRPLWEIRNNGTAVFTIEANGTFEATIPNGSISVGDENNLGVAVPAGLDTKADCVAATTGNITLANSQTIDGVAVVNPNRVLVKDQTTASENGIYVVVDAGSWTRSTDADTDAEVNNGMLTEITSGTANATTAWVITTVDPIVVDTTSLIFQELSLVPFGISGLTDGTVTQLDSSEIVFEQDGSFFRGPVRPNPFRQINVRTQAQLEAKFGTNLVIPDNESWTVSVDGPQLPGGGTPLALNKPFLVGMNSSLEISAVSADKIVLWQGVGPMIRNKTFGPSTLVRTIRTKNITIVGLAENSIFDIESNRTVFCDTTNFVTLNELGQVQSDICAFVRCTHTNYTNGGFRGIGQEIFNVEAGFSGNSNFNNFTMFSVLPKITTDNPTGVMHLTISNFREFNSNSGNSLFFLEPNPISGSTYVLNDCTTSLGDFYQRGTKLVITEVAQNVGNIVLTVDATAHGLVVGDSIVLSGFDDANYNGTFDVQAVAASTFEVTATFGATGKGFLTTSPLTITTVADAGGGDITLTTDITHGLSVSDQVQLSGFDDANYNGLFTVTAVNAGARTFDVTATFTATGTGVMDIAISAVADGGGPVTTITLVSGGTGYVVGDELTITGDTSTASNARITVDAVTSGVITAFTKLVGGSGYTSAGESVTLSEGTGSSATATVTITGDITLTSTTAHGLKVGKMTVLQDFADSNYNGTFIVNAISGLTFNVTATFTATGVGTMNANSANSASLEVTAQNNPGVADSMVAGEISLFDSGGLLVSTTTTAVPVAIGSSTWQATSLERTSVNSATAGDGKLKYIGIETSDFTVDYSATIKMASGPGQVVGINLLRTRSASTIAVEPNAIRLTSTGNTTYIFLQSTTTVNLQTDDELEVAVVNYDGTPASVDVQYSKMVLTQGA